MQTRDRMDAVAYVLLLFYKFVFISGLWPLVNTSAPLNKQYIKNTHIIEIADVES